MKSLTILFLTIATFTAILNNQSQVSAMESTTLAKCAMPTFQMALRDSKAIFAGKVVSVRKEGDEKIFKFKVEKYWKGMQSKTVEISYYENMRYQAWLKVGGRYLVYARGNDDGTLSDGRCSLTKNYSEAKGDLKLLGKGKILR
jgi:hypothetical protein